MKRYPEFSLVYKEESFVEKLRQLGSEIRQAIGSATGAQQPVPIPVRVED